MPTRPRLHYDPPVEGEPFSLSRGHDVKLNLKEKAKQRVKKQKPLKRTVEPHAGLARVAAVEKKAKRAANPTKTQAALKGLKGAGKFGLQLLKRAALPIYAASVAKDMAERGVTAPLKDEVDFYGDLAGLASGNYDAAPATENISNAAKAGAEYLKYKVLERKMRQKWGTPEAATRERRRRRGTSLTPEERTMLLRGRK